MFGIKIGGTKWNKLFIPNIPLPSFLRRPAAATSGDLLSGQIRWLWTCGGGGGGSGGAVVVVELWWWWWWW